MKKIMYGLVLLLAVCSCGNKDVLNTSIIEPLAPEVLKAQIDKDPQFEVFYEDVLKARTWIMETEVKRAKYGFITYRRLIDFARIKSDAKFNEDIYEKEHKYYTEHFPDYTPQVDSVMQYWNNYRNENTLNSFIKLEIVDIDASFSAVDCTVLRYSIIPKEPVGYHFYFDFTFLSRDKSNHPCPFENENHKRNAENHKFVYQRGLYTYKQEGGMRPEPITTSYWTEEEREWIKNMDVESLNKYYIFKYDVYDAWEDTYDGHGGKKYLMDYILGKIPVYVKQALDDNALDGGQWKDQIIKTVIAPDYISFTDYMLPVYENYVREIDKDVYDLYAEKYETELSDELDLPEEYGEILFVVFKDLL